MTLDPFVAAGVRANVRDALGGAQNLADKPTASLLGDNLLGDRAIEILFNIFASEFHF